ncbi:MAG: hypothetical protein QOF61_1133, partial [Acidobacteriota bacterium]|nr:hypothetical protein [Acidobacteriota bacterium]
ILSYRQTSGGLNVTAPGSGTLCPPGHYMLFLVNSNGVPSVASIIQITSTSSQNAIDDQRYFVRQHYYDFLLREADDAGLAFWTNQITQCGNDAACIDRKRIDVSRAFWYASEFQQQPRAANLRNPFPPPDFNSREFVRLCYLVYLQRQPDDPGLNYWTSVLDQDIAHGIGYDHLIKAFLVSDEYRNRFSKP